ncbi:MAG: divalent-cation tolerance protein CutA [Gammaproteobacteria bacterium]|nr:divalent-cation tolerance protein CutA [Gammaproteobacteria bacterium]
MTPTSRYCVVLTTCPDTALAERIAHALVEARHAACVNILPAIQSIYRWDGKLEQGREVLLLIKTEQTRLSEVERCIQTLHSYTVPEMIALPITHGHHPYLHWISESVTS